MQLRVGTFVVRGDNEKCIRDRREEGSLHSPEFFEGENEYPYLLQNISPYHLIPVLPAVTSQLPDLCSPHRLPARGGTQDFLCLCSVDLRHHSWPLW